MRADSMLGVIIVMRQAWKEDHWLVEHHSKVSQVYSQCWFLHIDEASIFGDKLRPNFSLKVHLQVVWISEVLMDIVGTKFHQPIG